MKKTILKLQIVVSSFFLVQCVVDTFDTRLTIINKTPEIIFVEISKDDQITDPPISFDSIKRDTIWDNMRWTPAIDSSTHLPPSLGSWEEYINEKCKDSTLTIFIFEKKLLKSVSQDSLILNQLYSKKYSYKLGDLKRLDWRIEYTEPL